MPKFPTYHGELPECLNPSKPYHYVLLAYWTFFRPTALKYYLYQADPEHYRNKMGSNILQTWNIPAYHNLYVMIFVISMVFSVLLGLPFTLLLGWNKGIPINWLLWIIGMAVGVVIGVGFGIGFGIILCVKNELAAGVALSTVLGVFSSIASSVWMGATAGIAFSVGFGGAFDIPLGVTTGLVFGAGAAGISCMAISSAFDWKVGVPVGLVCGIVTSVGVGGVFGIGGGIGIEAGFGVAFGLVGGIIASVVIGMALSAVGSVQGDFVLGVVSSLIFSAISILAVDAATGLGICIGVLRLVFYPFQLALALLSGVWRIKHPLEWDEQVVFPLPNTQKVLNQRLHQDEKKGLHFLADVGRNPFQRAAIQKVLYRYLHEHADPIRFFYTLLTDSDFEEYVLAPTKPDNWKQNATVYRLFLGELALQKVVPRIGIFSSSFERLAWWTSYPLREHKDSPLTLFARMLYNLLDENVVEAKDYDFSSYAETYNSLSDYSGSNEIAQTFSIMATFLSFDNLSALTGATEMSLQLAFDDAIRPNVITVLKKLGDVGAEIKAYQDSTSRTNQLAALARATDALKKLGEYAQAQVMTPEQHLLRRIIRQWQALIIAEGGEVGRAEITGPVANPYVVGNPVTSDLFVGREDSLRRLEELWSGTGQKPSVVLYGHRRMGKSSILHNLGARFGKDALIVDFNMQRVGMVESTGELLHSLALAIYDKLPIEKRRMLQEPDEERFLTRNPYKAFDDRFLKEIDRLREEQWFIITIDEFELIEARIEEGILEARLLEFWRGLIQTYPWFVMAFAGLHTLREMTQDYWNPLFGSVTGIPISFLKAGAARTLITQPSPDFDIDYDTQAIERIIGLTYGQPYLIQLICHCLVTHFNRQKFEEGIERERRFRLEDIEAVINAPEFYRDGDAYFTGVWKQAETGDAPGQQDVLCALAQTETGMLLEELIQQTDRASEDLQKALEVLERHDVITEHEGRWQFTVELMRRWVIQNLK